MIMVTALIAEAMADPQTGDLFEHILIKPVEMKALCALVLKALERASGPESAQATVGGCIGGSTRRHRTMLEFTPLSTA
jgi:hypothetical protein